MLSSLFLRIFLFWYQEYYYSSYQHYVIKRLKSINQFISADTIWNVDYQWLVAKPKTNLDNLSTQSIITNVFLTVTFYSTILDHFFVNVDFKQFSIKPWDSFIHFLSDFLPIKAVTIIHSEPGGGDTFLIFTNNSFDYKLKLIKNLKYLNQKTLFSLKTINKLIYYRRNRQKWNL